MTTPLPLPVEKALLRLGQQLSLARRRRHLSQEDLAERIGASVNTVRRLEDGYPGIAMQTFARALQVFGELDKLTKFMDTPEDTVGLVLMDGSVPQRVRRRKRESGAL
jgi:transcriptional regulator with XRE-family HTH domain